MAQHDYNLANQSGADFRADLNNALSAIATVNSGATEPSTTFAHQLWVDTASNVLKIRNATNNGWITTGVSITASNTFTGNITGDVVGDITGDLTGNADTATTLATARTINGVSFDGSANISFDTDSVSEGSSNLYFTNERVDDQVNTLLQAGTGIQLTYDDTAGTLTIANTNDADITEVVAGDGLTGGGASGSVSLSVSVDDSSIEINSDSLRVKALGVTNAMLAGSIANAKLSNSSVTINSNSLSLGGTLTLDTNDIAENTNLYFTDARARASISEDSTQLSYNSTTGVLSFTQGDTDTVSEGSSNLYFTNERVDDRVSSLVQNGTGISWVYNDTSGTLTPTISLSSFTTSDLTESGNLYFTNERVDDRVSGLIQNGTGISWSYDDTAGTFTPAISLSPFNTSQLSESGNLYYTDTRANSAIDTRVTKSFVDALNVQAASVDANSVALGTDTTGNYVQTITGTANKITVSGSGSESADITLSLPDDVQIASDLTVAGNLTVNGTLTSLDTTNLDIEDNLFQLNAGLTGSPVNDSGMLINRGSSDNGIFMWDESTDKFTLGLTTADGTATGNITLSSLGTLVANLEGAVTGTVSSISNHNTDSLTEGSSNIYYTDTRANSAIDARVTNTFINNLSGVIADTATALQTARTINGTSFDGTANITFDTDSVNEGSSNLYFTNARARSSISASGDISYNSTTGVISFTQATAPVTSVNTQTGAVVLDTDDIAENTNLYYTDARANSAIDARVTKTFVDNLSVAASTADTLSTARTINGVSFDGSANITTLTAGTGVSVSGTQVSIGQAVGSSDSPTFSNLTLNGTDSIKVPVGTTAQRNGSPTAGMFRYNSTTGEFEGYTTEWGAIAGGGNGSYTTDIFTATSGQTAFTLSASVSNENNLIVFVDGVFQAQNTYSVSGTTLTFATGIVVDRVVTVYHVEPVSIGTPSDGTVTSAKLSGALTTPSDLTVTGTLDADGLTVNSGAAHLNVSFATSNAAGYDSTLSLTAGASGGVSVLNLGYDGDTDYSRIFRSGTNLIFDNNNAERMRIDSSGNVQIGTSSHVNLSGGTTELTIGTSGDADTSGGGISFAHNGSTLNGYILGQKSSLGVGSQTGFTYLVAGGSERMRIDSSGAVGINNTVASTINAANASGNLVVGSGSGSEGITVYSGNTSLGSLCFADGTSSTSTFTGYVTYNHSSNHMEFGAGNGTEKMRITSDGRVGIGITSPTGSLHITNKDDGGSDVNVHIQNTTANRLAGLKLLDENGTVHGVFRYDNGGNNASLGVGTGSPSAPLHVVGNAVITGNIISTGDTNIIYDSDDNCIFSRANGNETMRMNSSGNLLVGTTSGSVNLVIGGTSDSARIIPATDNVGYIGESTHRWQAIYAVNGSIQTSDEREKTEIKETTLGLDFIKDLKPVSYKWIDGEQQNKGKDEREHQGLIAQQVAETVEKHGIDKNTFGGLDIQKTEKYDDLHGMSYGQFVAPLVKAIQEQQEQIEELKQEIQNLKGE